MLTKNDVKKIARLARLDLTDAEVDKFTGQLSAILGHADMLKEVNTDCVEPIAQITGLTNVQAADETFPEGAIGQSRLQGTNALLKCSPQPVSGRMIKVKNVF